MCVENYGFVDVEFVEDVVGDGGVVLFVVVVCVVEVEVGVEVDEYVGVDVGDVGGGDGVFVVDDDGDGVVLDGVVDVFGELFDVFRCVVLCVDVVCVVDV